MVIKDLEAVAGAGSSCWGACTVVPTDPFENAAVGMKFMRGYQICRSPHARPTQVTHAAVSLPCAAPFPPGPTLPTPTRLLEPLPTAEAGWAVACGGSAAVSTRRRMSWRSPVRNLFVRVLYRRAVPLLASTARRLPQHHCQTGPSLRSR